MPSGRRITSRFTKESAFSRSCAGARSRAACLIGAARQTSRFVRRPALFPCSPRSSPIKAEARLAQSSRIAISHPSSATGIARISFVPARAAVCATLRPFPESHSRIRNDVINVQTSTERRRPHRGRNFWTTTRRNFRVWAPHEERVSVVIGEEPELKIPHRAEPRPRVGRPFLVRRNGRGARPFYRYRLASGDFPIPRRASSRSAPMALAVPSIRTRSNGPTRLARRAPTGQILYEMHVGTFTPEGTCDGCARAARASCRARRHRARSDAGRGFPGRYGWGYDGVNLFARHAALWISGRLPAPCRCGAQAGHRRDSRRSSIITSARTEIISRLSRPIFHGPLRERMGESINFDGPLNEPVRAFFLANAAYWIAEFHLDGLRLDATQQIFDASPSTFSASLSARLREAAANARRISSRRTNHSTSCSCVRSRRRPRARRSVERRFSTTRPSWRSPEKTKPTTPTIAARRRSSSRWRNTLPLPGAKRYRLAEEAAWDASLRPRRLAFRDVHPEPRPDREFPPRPAHSRALQSRFAAHDDRAAAARARHADVVPGAGVRRIDAVPFISRITIPSSRGSWRRAVANFLKQFPSPRSHRGRHGVAGSRERGHLPPLQARLRRRGAARRRVSPALRSHRTAPDGSAHSRRRRDDAASTARVLAEEAFVLRYYFGQRGDDRLLLFISGGSSVSSPCPSRFSRSARGATWRMAWSSEEIRYAARACRRS